MSKPIAVSPRAQRSIDGIADWTRERYGSRQARAYVGRLTDALRKLGAGTLLVRSAGREWGEGVRKGLLFVRVEKHVVLFLEEPGEVVVVDVLHEAMDIARRTRE